MVYVEHIKGIKKLHEREFERRYHFSSLKYFERELGLSQKKELEEEGMLRDNSKKILSGTGLQLCGDDLKMY